MLRGACAHKWQAGLQRAHICTLPCVGQAAAEFSPRACAPSLTTWHGPTCPCAPHAPFHICRFRGAEPRVFGVFKEGYGHAGLQKMLVDNYRSTRQARGRRRGDAQLTRGLCAPCTEQGRWERGVSRMCGEFCALAAPAVPRAQARRQPGPLHGCFDFKGGYSHRQAGNTARTHPRRAPGRHACPPSS
jgi:hypothetical protein